MLEYFTERTPGSVTEVRDSCMAWHYRDCDVGHGNWQAKQAMVSLVELAKRTKAIEVCVGEKIIEVRPSACPAPSVLQIALAKLESVAQQARRDSLNLEEAEKAAAPRPAEGGEDGGGASTTSSSPGSGFVEGVMALNDEGGQRGGELGQHGSVESALSSLGNLSSNSLPSMMGGDIQEPARGPAHTETPPVDFVLFVASGDDLTDEDTFSILVS